MPQLILVLDEKNFLIKYILKNLIEYARPAIWPYDKFLHDKHSLHSLSEKVFYLTPVGSVAVISKIKKIIENKMPRIINPLNLQILDKPGFDKVFAENGMPHPESILAKSSVEAMNFIRKHRVCIIKSRNDCGGSGHFVVRDGLAYLGGKRFFLNFEEGTYEKREIAKDNLLVCPPFYMQKFLLPDDNSVWRAYIVGRRTIFFTIRKRDSYESLGEYIINVARGAKYYFPKNDLAVKEACDRFAETISLEIGAIDFVFHQGNPYFLEVNCEGIWILICRKFYEYLGYDPQKHNLDRFILEYFNKKA